MAQAAILLATLGAIARTPASPEPPTSESNAALAVPLLTGSYDNRFLLQIPASGYSLQPVLFLQGLFSLPRNAALANFYEGAGFSFRRAGWAWTPG